MNTELPEPAPESANVGGWAMENLGRIAQEGDSFEALGLQVTVTACDGPRVEEIIVQKEEI